MAVIWTQFGGKCFHFWKVEQGGCWCSWMFMPLTCLCYPLLPSSLIQPLVMPMDWVSGLCPSVVLSYLLSLLSLHFRPHYLLSKPLRQPPLQQLYSGLLRLPAPCQHAPRWIFSISCYTAPSLTPPKAFCCSLHFRFQSLQDVASIALSDFCLTKLQSEPVHTFQTRDYKCIRLVTAVTWQSE